MHGTGGSAERVPFEVEEDQLFGFLIHCLFTCWPLDDAGRRNKLKCRSANGVISFLPQDLITGATREARRGLQGGRRRGGDPKPCIFSTHSHCARRLEERCDCWVFVDQRGPKVTLQPGAANKSGVDFLLY